MPSKSKTQFRYIQSIRSKYKNEKDTPTKYMWVWDDEWTSVDYDSLPDDANEFITIKEYLTINDNKEIFLFDFDDTIIRTEASIKVKDTDGSIKYITHSELDKYQKKGCIIDFDEYNDMGVLMNGKLIEPVFSILKDKYKESTIGIVTGRDNPKLIKDFFLSKGIDIPMEFIYTVTHKDFTDKYGTDQMALLKKHAVKEIINKGFNIIHFYDDNVANISYVNTLNDKDTIVRTYIITSADDIVLNESVTQKELNQIEKSADIYFKQLGLDLEFTRHFIERVNDTRNHPDISADELSKIFREVFNEYAYDLKQLKDNFNGVFKDMETDINCPFVINLDFKTGEVDIIMKTIMRKKDFKSSTPFFKI